MNRKPRLLPSAMALLGVAVFYAAAAAAQPADNEKKEKAPDASIHEQDIYIPYEKLREVFEKHGRGVFLPYEKFRELWRAAREKTPRPTDEKPPVAALITEIENRATVEKDAVRVNATLTIEVLAEGWHSVPLRLGDAAITRATIGDRPARIVGGPERGYELLIEKKAEEPETIELELVYAKSVSRSPGRNSVSFQAPRAAVSRWRVEIPRSGVKVELHPLIAATEVPAEKSAEGEQPEETKDSTIVLAFVGAAPTVGIDWTPKAEGAAGLEAMASVRAEEQVWIDEGVVRTRAALDYSISRAALSRLEIEAPAGQKVANLFDPNVRRWSVENRDGRQRISVELFEPADESQRVIVELEKFLPEGAKYSIDAPPLNALDAGRQQGVVVVRLAEGLRAEPVKTTGLLQIDAAELRSELKKTDWDFAYRYAAVPFTLTLEAEKVRPRISVDALVEADLQPDRLTLDLTAVYTIEKAGVFRLQWEVPPGFDVRRVGGRRIGDAEPVKVDSHFLEGERKNRLAINLSRKAIGKVALGVRLEKELDRPELMTPTGKAAQFSLPAPRVPEAAAERCDGRMLLYAPESLRVNPKKSEGLRSISFKEALELVRPPSRSAPADRRPVLAFAYSRQPAELTFAAERRKPQTTIRQLVVARVEEGVVKYDFTLAYEVRYSGVKSLRLDVPAGLAPSLRIVALGVRKSTIEPPPDDLEKDYTAWRLSGDAEFFGQGKIKLSCEEKIEKLEVGEPVELAIQRLIPREIDRAWGQIALVKSETIDVHPAGEPKSLQPIDPRRDLVDPVADAARALEFYGDWALKILVTRYELEEVKRTSVERALVRMVVTPAEVVSVQALYRMLSNRQRLVVQLPAGAEFDAQPLRINGRPAPLEKGGENQYFIPLSGTGGDEPFLVELRYTLAGDGGRLVPPIFPQEPAVVQEYLCAYLPEKQRLLSARGPWTEEFGWRPDRRLRWRPRPNRDPDRLDDWVREGISESSEAADDFATDGDPYLFSTLRPAPPPDGVLRLKTIDDRFLSALLFLGAVALGILLLPARLPLRAVVVCAAVIALVLAGVFWPILARQLLGGVLPAAVFVVAVLWIAAAAARRPARRPVKPEPADRDHGVDLSQYRPEPPASEPSEKSDEQEKEGGRNDE